MRLLVVFLIGTLLCACSFKAAEIPAYCDNATAVEQTTESGDAAAEPDPACEPGNETDSGGDSVVTKTVKAVFGVVMIVAVAVAYVIIQVPGSMM